MNAVAADHWQRAHRAIASARLLHEAGDHDGAASRAYYAAFHAVSAGFALDEVHHTKHSQLEAAVHRDLVREGRLAVDVGQAFSALREYRELGDYGGANHIQAATAKAALESATLLIEAVARAWPALAR